MSSVTIIVSHFESMPFLRACIRRLRAFAHPDIEQHIIIAEQSMNDDYGHVVREFSDQPDITIVRTQSLYSGHSIDHIMRYVDIKTEFICQLHVDAFPINKNWLLLPITLIEEDGFYFVGQTHFYTRPTDTIYYLKNMFFGMSPTFNVARTETYREMAMEGGFTRFHERTKISPPMVFNNTDWEEWAKADYWRRGSDDDVLAFCWEDNYREHNKLGLPITALIGIPPESGYGRVIDDLVFHFGFSCESKGVMEHMGERYGAYTNRINEGFTDALIEEMIAQATPTGATAKDVWDGNAKIVSASSAPLNEKIEYLKRQ